jgi:16S rRNA (uracil1498-N3)-methyltransferase
MTETHAKIIIAILVLLVAGAIAFMWIHGVDLRKAASE